MNTLVPYRTRLFPNSEDELRLIRNELAELLKTPHFSNSKRYPALLSYVVEKTLAGQSDELKERILGIEVFHRPSNYDTNSDTVVRVAAGEVRRRLALIYHEGEVEHAIQISLPAGSYVPEFSRTVLLETPDPSIPADTALDQHILQAKHKELTPAATPIPLRPNWRNPGVALAMVVLAAGFVALFLHLRGASHQSSVDLFWQPIRTSSPAIICPGALVRSTDSPSGMVIAQRTDDYPYTSIATTVSVAELVNSFSANHIEYVIQPTSSTTLADMREHPVILLGAYNNEWTGRLQNDLRYRFSADPARQIFDAINPSTTWMRPASLPLREEDDFAVVARFHSKLTDNWIVLIAGIGRNGLEAAAQFATTPRYMDLLNQQQSKDWASKNIEIVLKVKVIQAKNGAPSVEAMYVW